ncbi:hypothetical protein Q3G72_035395 [Acer saccharum]|nr:hypothetical protein Q3G72_035395 [Acer saccharum]
MAGGSRNQMKGKGKQMSNKHKHTKNVQSQQNSKSEDEKMEKLLLKSFGGMYNEACKRLVVSCGYQHDVALKAIVANGHAFGNRDVITNIVQNSLYYLKIDMKVFHEPPPQTLNNSQPTTRDDDLDWFELVESCTLDLVVGDVHVDPKIATVSCLIDKFKEHKQQAIEKK